MPASKTKLTEYSFWRRRWRRHANREPSITYAIKMTCTKRSEPSRFSSVRNRASEGGDVCQKTFPNNAHKYELFARHLSTFYIPFIAHTFRVSHFFLLLLVSFAVRFCFGLFVGVVVLGVLGAALLRAACTRYVATYICWICVYLARKFSRLSIFAYFYSSSSRRGSRVVPAKSAEELRSVRRPSLWWRAGDDDA